MTVHASRYITEFAHLRIQTKKRVDFDRTFYPVTDEENGIIGESDDHPTINIIN